MPKKRSRKVSDMNIKKLVKGVSAFAIMAAMVLGECNVGTVSAKTLEELRAERNKLQQETEQARKSLAAVKEKQATLEEEIEALDGVINAANTEYDRAKADYEEVSARLAQSEADLEAAKEKKEDQIDILGDRLVFLHENGDIGYIETILNSESFSDMLLTLQYVQDIMEYDTNMIDELTATEEIIRQETEDIRVEKEESEQLFKLAEDKKNELDGILAEKTALMKDYHDNEAKYERLIESNMRASQEAETLINQLLKSSGSGPEVYSYSGGELGWPVPSRAASSSSLSSGFIYRKKPIGSGYEYHSGYDIPAPYGSDIVAAEAGEVIYSGWMNGYGNTIMINHGGGIVTLYAHNSSLVVSKGESVVRGQVVSKCGSTGNSTGNHCHFEVRLNGTAVSPEPYLGVKNISV